MNDQPREGRVAALRSALWETARISARHSLIYFRCQERHTSRRPTSEPFGKTVAAIACGLYLFGASATGIDLPVPVPSPPLETLGPYQLQSVSGSTWLVSRSGAIWLKRPGADWRPAATVHSRNGECEEARFLDDLYGWIR